MVAIAGVVGMAASSRRGSATDSVIVAEPAGVPSAAAPAGEPNAHPPRPMPAPATLADASRVVSIEMYSAAWCQACSRAKAWMREQNITFHEVDVDRRAGALAQLQMLNPRSSLPTFDIDGHVVVGFDEPRLRTAIDEAARRPR